MLEMWSRTCRVMALVMAGWSNGTVRAVIAWRRGLEWVQHTEGAGAPVWLSWTGYEVPWLLSARRHPGAVPHLAIRFRLLGSLRTRSAP